MTRPDRLIEMISLCRQGRPEGYARLIEDYGPRLFSYFRQVSPSSDDAEDLLQEFFVKFIKAISRYRHELRFEHWLFRIAANLARDRARAAGRRIRPVSFDDAGDRSEPLTKRDIPSSEPPPDQRIQHSETADRLHDALAELADADREIILLRHYGGLSFKEIAEQYNLPVGTVLSKVHRGLKQLRKILDHEQTGHE